MRNGLVYNRPMKFDVDAVFALANGGAKREDKDFPDRVQLVIENRVHGARELGALCRPFGMKVLYARWIKVMNVDRFDPA